MEIESDSPVRLKDSLAFDPATAYKHTLCATLSFICFGLFSWRHAWR
jgi:hypothetical protein